MACTTNYRKTKSKWETDDGFGPGDRVRPGWILREVKCVRHLCAGELASAYFRHFVCMWGLKGSDIGLRTGTLAVRESARVFVCVCVCVCSAPARANCTHALHNPPASRRAVRPCVVGCVEPTVVRRACRPQSCNVESTACKMNMCQFEKTCDTNWLKPGLEENH